MITSNRSFFIVILLFFAMSMFSYLHADINAELTISEPEEDFFRPREIMTAFLVLTNDDGDTLWFDEAEENGIQIVELSVSGPRQHYVSLEDYFRLEIVSGREGLIEDSGFDPDLNLIEIEIPRNIGDYGTYSIVFWIQREVDDEEFNVFPTIDFQLGQLAQTFTPSDRYKTCIECHDSPECTETHNDNINNCVKCHTRDIDLAFNGFIHTTGDHPYEEDVECSECHIASGGIGEYGQVVCDECHSIRAECRNFQDNQCVECHGNEAYSEHDQERPNRPRSFDLLSPEDETVLDTNFVELSWEETTDRDDDDEIIYVVDLCQDDEFDDYQVYVVGEETTLELTNLQENSEFWWRVRALDLNSEGRTSRQEWKFTVAGPQPPSEFNLLSPLNGDSIDIYHTPIIDFIWSASSDPNEADSLYYEFFLYCTDDFRDLIYQTQDTSITINLLDSLNSMDIDFWYNTFEASWFVDARSGDDVTRCEEIFTLDILPNRQSRFNLLEPSNGDTLGVEGSFLVNCAWEPSVYPYQEENTEYSVHFSVSKNDEVYDLDYYNIEQEELVINIPDSLDFEYWEKFPIVDWWVMSSIENDSTVSNSRFRYYIHPNPNYVSDNKRIQPEEFSISSAFPNPFNSMISVVVDLYSETWLEVGLFNLTGKEIGQALTGQYSAGNHTLSFNAEGLPSGEYLLRYSISNQHVGVQKVVLIR